MTQPPIRLWLARDGHVHGPYDPAQLMEMDANCELLATDSFCQEGAEDWLTHEQWRDSLNHAAKPKPRQTVVRPRSTQSDAPDHKTKKFKLDQPRHLASLPSPKVASAARMPQPKPEAEVYVDPQRRLQRMAEAINDHRRTHPHRHPFYFAEPQQLGDVLAWLDSHHRGWDAIANFDGPSALEEVLNRSLIPAIAFVKPDLVKPSHRADFGEGRPWQSFEEA